MDRMTGAAPSAPAIRIATTLLWSTLALYAAVLVAGACLFIHERYGLWIPVGLIAVPCIAILTMAATRPAPAASLALGVAAGVVTAGGFFWFRYAFYAPGTITRMALGATAAAALGLAFIARRQPGRPRGPFITTLAYVVAAITFGQGVPDRDPMRPNALMAAATVQRLVSRLAQYSAKRGTFPVSMDEVRSGETAPGYQLSYSSWPNGSAASPSPARYTLTAIPTTFGVTGCHAFFANETRRLTYTRRPRAPTADDLTWR